MSSKPDPLPPAKPNCQKFGLDAIAQLVEHPSKVPGRGADVGSNQDRDIYVISFSHVVGNFKRKILATQSVGEHRKNCKVWEGK